jgi:hypothetical protein
MKDTQKTRSKRKFRASVPSPHGIMLSSSHTKVFTAREFYCLPMNTVRNEVLKPEINTPGPDSWDYTCQIHPLTTVGQIKTYGKEQRQEIYYMVWDMQ